MRKPIYSETACVATWGSSINARRVTHLTPAEREAVRNGREVRIANCPSYRGCTERRIVARGNGFFTRMPEDRT